MPGKVLPHALSKLIMPGQMQSTFNTCRYIALVVRVHIAGVLSKIFLCTAFACNGKPATGRCRLKGSQSRRFQCRGEHKNFSGCVG